MPEELYDNRYNLEIPGIKKMASGVSNELDKWVDRVIYDVKFKKNTDANLERLHRMVDESLSHFVTIAANSEALVYKICRWMIANAGVKSDEISILNGTILESYIGGDTVEWKKIDRLDDFFNFFGTEYRGHWVAIPETAIDMSVGLTVYLMSSLKKVGAIGLVVYGAGPNNMVENIFREIEDRNCYQFPKELMKRRRRSLPADEW